MKRVSQFDAKKSTMSTGSKNKKQVVKLSEDTLKEIKEAFEMYDQEGK